MQRKNITAFDVKGGERLNDSASIVKSTKTLHALTSAALVLPGLLLPSVPATAKDRINFQYSRYQEGERNLFGAPNTLKPITADVLHGSGLFSLTDRAKFSFGCSFLFC